MTMNRQRERGATLLVGMIMLLMMTLLAVTAFRINKNELQIVGNAQQKAQMLPAAQAAIEQTVSSTRFMTTPANAIASPCNGANTTCSDFNGDGASDVVVKVTPTCVSTQILPVGALDYADPNDAGCLINVGQDFGVVGATNNNSMCANMLWDIQAKATDTVRETQITVNQGAAIRAEAINPCP
ncbi:Tfp pilus assembly protein PilX [Noviherbaspirillum humi]|uniref:Tfp pilus assembly protein PilX n=1 Tax=Noviherbaspirillum humi TaxID=1688639 RepID=A0A239DKJ5_9BURK|nr:hypothetical protein [Noviherbaspirillum humi]SNS32937.1 Tfp pilus assembly protein PilX [Noviherbaspirillum humi]